jgi:hypothetical protein
MVARVDLIAGDVRGPLLDRHAAINETTKVVARFAQTAWARVGDDIEVVTTLPAITRNMYFRVRGTNTNDLEPAMDVPGENPWTDLWFYSNPIFINVATPETSPAGAKR